MTPAPISGFNFTGTILRWTEPTDADEVQIEVSFASGAPFTQVFYGSAKVTQRDIANFIPPGATVLYARGKGKKGGIWGVYTDPPAQFSI